MAEIKRTLQLTSADGLVTLHNKAELIIPRDGTVICSTLYVEGAADSLQGKTLVQDNEYWSLGYTSIEVSGGTGKLVVYERA